VSFLAASSLQAQEISKDLGVLSLSGSLKSTSALGGSSSGSAGLGYEAFLSDRVALGGVFEARRSSAELSATAAFHLAPRKSGSPYVSARAGMAFSSEEDPVFAGSLPPTLGVGVGFLKLFGGPRHAAGFRLELLYSHYFCGERTVGDMIFPSYGVDQVSAVVAVTLSLRPRH
jgi:hypothetical protein